MHKDVRRASRKELRRKIRGRLRGRRATLTTIAMSVAGVLAIAGVVPALASGTDVATPTPSASVEQTSSPTESPAPAQTESPSPSPTETSVSGDESVEAEETAPEAWVSRIAPTEEPQQTTATVVAGTTVRVNKAVLRDATADKPYVAGAVFELWTTTNPSAPVGAAWSTCTIAVGATSCDILVPVASTGVQYRVVEKTPGPGTFALGSIATGSATGALTAQPYPGNTGVLPSSGTVDVPLTPSSGASSSIGKTTNAITNPELSPSCVSGLKVGLVLDVSTSIENTNAEKGAYATAVRNLVNNLVTPADLITITPITFNNSATVQTSLSGVASSARATAVYNYLNNYSNYAAATNWDDALEKAAAGDYDVVLMVTDGAPTRSRSTNSADSVRVFHVENAVLSANQAKAGGAPVWAVGVALPGGSETNLKAISGTTLNKDYFTTDFSQLNQRLKTIAQGLTCQVPITVDKTEIAPDGKETTLRGGWQFSASLVAGSAGTLTGAASQTTVADDAGSVEWVQSFTDPSQRASLTVTETPKTDWSLESVTCLNRGSTPVAVTVVGNAWTVPSFGVGDSISCTVKNRNAGVATVQVNKTWVVKDSAGKTLETYYIRGNGADPATPSWLSGSPTITGIAPAPSVTGAAWATSYGGYIKGNQVQIGESASVNSTSHPGCTLTSQALTSANGVDVVPPTDLAGGKKHTATLVTGANTFVVTNTVTCAQTLELVKKVAFGAASPNAWTLSGTKPLDSPALQGPSGKYTTAGSVKAPVSAGVAYTLGETGGPAEYVQDGAWSCVAGDQTVSADNGKVTVPLGGAVVCTATNTTAQVVLLKHVTDQSLKPGDWTLTAQPGVQGLTAKTTTGAEVAGGTNTFDIKPNTTYSISEALTAGPGTIAYRQLGIEQLQPDGVTWVAVSSNQITVAPGVKATYRFVNDKVPAVVLPLTGGTSTDAFVFGGIIALLLAAMLTVWHSRRTLAARRN